MSEESFKSRNNGSAVVCKLAYNDEIENAPRFSDADVAVRDGDTTLCVRRLSEEPPHHDRDPRAGSKYTNITTTKLCSKSGSCYLKVEEC